MSLSRIFARPFFVASLAWLLILGALYVAADYWVMPALAGQFKKTSPVPGLVGLKPEAAQKALGDAKLLYMLDSTGDYSQNIPAGHILSQFPPAGTVVKQGRRVWVKVSKGFKAVEVPVLRGLSLRQAEISLQQAGLKMGKVVEILHSDIPAGAVIGSVPAANAKVETGRTVVVHLSLGVRASAATMPALRGMSLAQAKQKLEGLGLTLGRVTEKSDGRSLPKTILDQSPAAGATLKGEPVDLTVSK